MHQKHRNLLIVIDIVLTVLLPLLLSAVIYISTREHSIYFISWMEQYINVHSNNKPQLPQWIIFNLPDGLWTFAFASLLLIVWKRKIHRSNLLWLCFPLISAIFLEFTWGTFDLTDLYFIIVGGLLAFVIPSNHYLITKKQVNV